MSATLSEDVRALKKMVLHNPVSVAWEKVSRCLHTNICIWGESSSLFVLKFVFWCIFLTIYTEMCILGKKANAEHTEIFWVKVSHYL